MFEQGPARERYMYKRSPASVLRRGDFSLQDAIRKVTAYEQWARIDGRDFLVPVYSDSGVLPSGGQTMNFWDSGLGKVIWRGWAITLGMMLFAKLVFLVIWVSIRHPLSDSIIDYEHGIVRLKKNK